MNVDTELPIEAVSFVFVDVETSGLRPDRGARLTEIAVLGARAPELTWTGAPGDDAALRKVLPRVQSLLTGAVIVGHNVGFDLRFLARESDRLGVGGLRARYVDTLPLARRVASEVGLSLPDLQLSTLVDALDLTPDGEMHAACVDAAVTREAFWALVRLGDVTTLRDAGLQQVAWA